MEAKEGKFLVHKCTCEFDVFKRELYRFASYKETNTSTILVNKSSVRHKRVAVVGKSIVVWARAILFVFEYINSVAMYGEHIHDLCLKYCCP